MLKDIKNIRIQGANFETQTQLPLLCDGNRPAKGVDGISMNTKTIFRQIR